MSNNGLVEGKGGEGSKEDEDRQEFILNRGKALDTILHDYPNIFMHAPDFSVYRDDISLTDSAGFSVRETRHQKNQFPPQTPMPSKRAT